MDMASVARGREQARASYDRLSRYYDLVAGRWEWPWVRAALALLAVQPGETVLEIGFGTGRALASLAEAVGEAGHVDGLDISPRMRDRAQARLAAAGLAERAGLACGDAAAGLPYADARFDALFMSFTLELFDTPDIPVVLAGCRRVLRPGGRLGMAAMVRPEGAALPRALLLYEWLHRRFPNVVDCRPIPAAALLLQASFRVLDEQERRLYGLPVALLLASPV